MRLTGSWHASAHTKDSAQRTVLEKNINPVRTKSGHESVQMIDRRDEAATKSATVAATHTPVTATIKQVETATVSSASVSQPKIDMNRLTDEVYRMLERRLVTERERRGR